jgi:hypothetical protein
MLVFERNLRDNFIAIYILALITFLHTAIDKKSQVTAIKKYMILRKITFA